MSAIKTIEVNIRGFPPVTYSHVSASAAFARAWESYCSAYECTFKHFMTIARRHIIPNPPGVGEPIRVLGRNAWTLEPQKHTTQFVYDGEKVVMTAHHSEIEQGHTKEGQADG